MVTNIINRLQYLTFEQTKHLGRYTLHLENDDRFWVVELQETADGVRILYQESFSSKAYLGYGMNGPLLGGNFDKDGNPLDNSARLILGELRNEHNFKPRR